MTDVIIIKIIGKYTQQASAITKYEIEESSIL